jgi:hypothetical protein
MKMTVYDLISDEMDKRLLERMITEDGEVNDIELEFKTKSDEKRPAYFL